MKVNALNLRQSYSCSDIGHPVIVADDWKPITTVRINSLSAKQSQACRKLIIVRCNHSTFASRNNFVAEKAEGGAVAHPTDPMTAIFRSHRLSSILDHKQAMSFGYLQNRVKIDRMTV